jgi:signal transduction histidine kinase
LLVDCWLTSSTVTSAELYFVWNPGDFGLCRAADIQAGISAVRQMKSTARGVTVVGVTRLPRGESLDRLVAAGLVVLAQVELWATSAISGPKGLTLPLTTLIAGSVAVRRRWPFAVAVFAMVAFTVMLVVGGQQTSVAIGVAWICAVYGLAVWTDTRRFIAGCGVLVSSSILAQLRPEGKASDAVTFIVVPGLAMLIARRAIRDRQLLAESLAARAELLERDQELRAHQAVAEERARIARELHDLVAHNVSVMVVQAGVERHALGEEQASARAAFAAIEQAGRQALAEARRLLGMLRRKGDSEELEPQPSIDQIDVLIEQVERAGLPVKLDIAGERVPLPAGVDLCAYRIVQEGLTNALKHAGPARAEVLLRYAPRALDIEVRDDGRGTPEANGDGAGHGLIGMRERVALYGGELETGPRTGGGFQIHAHLPLA